MWKGIRNTFGQYAWSWSLLIFGFGFAWYYSMYYPYIAVYKYNNSEVFIVSIREHTLLLTLKKEHIRREKKRKRDWLKRLRPLLQERQERRKKNQKLLLILNNMERVMNQFKMLLHIVLILQIVTTLPRLPKNKNYKPY